MKIADVLCYSFEWERGAYHWRDGIMPQGPKARGGLLRIVTDEGVEGVSPSGGNLDLEEIKFQLIGQDPMNRERIWQSFWKNLRSSRLGDAIGPVDVALWDLMGQVSGQPVYRLLGGVRDRVPAYASTLTLDSLDEYMALARDCLKKGYRAVKLHAWGRPGQDAELCRALRSEVGAEIELMYDASSMFSKLEDALRFGRELEQLDFLWYEEPVDHFSMQALRRLAAELTIPLAVAEATHGGPFDALSHIMAEAADIILTGPLDAYKGGFTGVMKTAAICQGFGMMCAVHGSSIACLHASCAIENCRYFERLVPEGFLEPPGVRTAATEIAEDGYAQPWERPGLGMEIDWDWVHAHELPRRG